MDAYQTGCQKRRETIEKVISEAAQGIKLAKCRKCGCMQDTLEFLHAVSIPVDLRKRVESWLPLMETIEYNCLGCEYCYPAIIMNFWHQAFPEQTASLSLACSWKVQQETWPPIPGEYFTFGEGTGCSVAVSTLASADLAEQLSRIRPPGLCIVGKTETENIGIDKIIKNTISNPTIRYLLLSGPDSQGHLSGQTLLALGENGVDRHLRVIGSPGRRPVLANVSHQEVKSFCRQVKVVNMIGCEEVERIVAKITELHEDKPQICTCMECAPEMSGHNVSVPVIKAEEVGEKKLDSAGYFVIIIQLKKNTIVVEHYSYDNLLLRVIEGKDARAICRTIIENGWITEFSHAAYLGRELVRAQLSLELGFKYVQDGA